MTTETTLIDQFGWVPSRYTDDDAPWWFTAIGVLFPVAVCSWLLFITRPVAYESIPVNVDRRLPSGAVVRFPQCEVDVVRSLSGCHGVGAAYSCALRTKHSGPADSYPGLGGIYVGDPVLVCPLQGRQYALGASFEAGGNWRVVYHWWDYLRGWLGGIAPPPPEAWWDLRPTLPPSK